MRIVAMLVALLVAARPAEACGYWSMTDTEKGFDIGFLINSASITKKKGARVGAFYLDIDSPKLGLRVVAKKKVVFDFKDNKLRKFGKPIATIDGNMIAFKGKSTYTIELTNPRIVHDVMLEFDLAVKRDGNVIVESKEASSLCAGLKQTMTDAEKEEEVRRRVFFYLAWRDVGAT
jgi:hypothetical protein